MVHSKVYLSVDDNIRADVPGRVSFVASLPDGSEVSERGLVFSGCDAAEGCSRRVRSLGALCCSAFFPDGRMVASAVFVRS